MGQRLDSFSKSGGEEERVAAIDRFSQKMINSGHSVKVGRNILVRGIKGQKGRVARSVAKNIPLHRSQARVPQQEEQRSCLQNQTGSEKLQMSSKSGRGASQYCQTE